MSSSRSVKSEQWDGATLVSSARASMESILIWAGVPVRSDGSAPVLSTPNSSALQPIIASLSLTLQHLVCHQFSIQRFKPHVLTWMILSRESTSYLRFPLQSVCAYPTFQDPRLGALCAQPGDFPAIASPPGPWSVSATAPRKTPHLKSIDKLNHNFSSTTTYHNTLNLPVTKPRYGFRCWMSQPSQNNYLIYFPTLPSSLSCSYGVVGAPCEFDSSAVVLGSLARR